MRLKLWVWVVMNLTAPWAVMMSFSMGGRPPMSLRSKLMAWVAHRTHVMWAYLGGGGCEGRRNGREDLEQGVEGRRGSRCSRRGVAGGGPASWLARVLCGHGAGCRNKAHALQAHQLPGCCHHGGAVRDDGHHRAGAHRLQCLLQLLCHVLVVVHDALVCGMVMGKYCSQ